MKNQKQGKKENKTKNWIERIRRRPEQFAHLSWSFCTQAVPGNARICTYAYRRKALRELRYSINFGGEWPVTLARRRTVLNTPTKRHREISGEREKRDHDALLRSRGTMGYSIVLSIGLTPFSRLINCPRFSTRNAQRNAVNTNARKGFPAVLQIATPDFLPSDDEWRRWKTRWGWK